MSRIPLLAAATAVGAAIAATAYAAQPESASSQSRAERACVEHGVQPGSAAWELCLSHVTRAYDWGELTLANQLARAAGDARVNCLENGQRPETPGYQTCVAREIEARSDLQILGDDQSGVNLAAAPQ